MIEASFNDARLSLILLRISFPPKVKSWILSIDFIVLSRLIIAPFVPLIVSESLCWTDEANFWELILTFPRRDSLKVSRGELMERRALEGGFRFPGQLCKAFMWIYVFSLANLFCSYLSSSNLSISLIISVFYSFNKSSFWLFLQHCCEKKSPLFSSSTIIFWFNLCIKALDVAEL